MAKKSKLLENRVDMEEFIQDTGSSISNEGAVEFVTEGMARLTDSEDVLQIDLEKVENGDFQLRFLQFSEGLGQERFRDDFMTIGTTSVFAPRTGMAVIAILKLSASDSFLIHSRTSEEEFTFHVQTTMAEIVDVEPPFDSEQGLCIDIPIDQSGDFTTGDINRVVTSKCENLDTDVSYKVCDEKSGVSVVEKEI